MNLDALLSQLSEQDVQLWAEAGQLKVRAHKDTLTPVLRALLAEHKTQILDRLISGASPKESKANDCSTVVENHFPLAFEQERYWHISQAIANDTPLNITLAVEWTGHLNLTMLQRALQEIVRRHAILRTLFIASEGAPVQKVLPQLDVDLAVIDQPIDDRQQQISAIRELTNSVATQSFDLAKAPLFQFTILRFSDTEAALIMVFHHIIIDVSSMVLLTGELAHLYETFSQGKPSSLPALKMQYTDFVVWQRSQIEGKQLAGEKHEEDRRYWTQQLAQLPPPATIPPDYPRSSTPTCQGTQQLFKLPPDRWRPVKQFCQRQGVTPFMVLLTALNVLIYRCSNQTDIVIGVPTSGRNHPEAQSLVGLFTYPIALRNHLSGDLSFQDLLAQVSKTALDGYDHQNLPEGKIVESLDFDQSHPIPYLYQVVLSYFGAQQQQIELSQSTVSLIWETSKIQTDLDLYLGVAEVQDGLEGVWIYNANLFRASTITALMDSYYWILEHCVNYPEMKISQVVRLPQIQGLRNLPENKLSA